MHKEELHVVFGASGGLGQAVVRELTLQGKKIRGVNRSGKADIPDSVEMVAANIMDLELGIAAAEGATHIYNCVNAPYDKWHLIYPDVATRFVSILKRTGAKGIIADNLYMYGEDIEEPLREDMSYNSKNKKGSLRATTSKIYEKAMENGEISAIIVRAPDFYGPGVTSSSFYGNRVFPNILKGKGVQVIGRLDVPHAMIYVDDYARALVTLANSSESIGEIWHVPMSPAMTQQKYLELIYELAGTSGKITSMPVIMMKILKLFIPMLREIDEMMYEWVRPYHVDSSKYENTFGNGTTSHREALQKTLDWYLFVTPQ